MKYIRGILNSIKRRGLTDTVRFIIYELIFEFKYKVDTIAEVELDDLTLKGSNKAYSERYQGANYFYFQSIMKKMKIDFANSTFIDYGSGKGRVLIMAGEYPFRKIIGVEFGKELVQTCNANLEKVKGQMKAKQFEVVHEDATQYDVAADINLFFLNNPFHQNLMEQVLDKIEESLTKHPRFVQVIYLNPRFNDSFLKRGYKIQFEISSVNKTEATIFSREKV